MLGDQYHFNHSSHVQLTALHVAGTVEREEVSDQVSIFYGLGMNRDEEVEHVRSVGELLQTRAHEEREESGEEDEGAG